MKVLIIVTPDFNVATTMNLIDPLRVANYLEGEHQFTWSLASSNGGLISASNGSSIDTKSLLKIVDDAWDLVIVSSSWAPEKQYTQRFLNSIRHLAKRAQLLGAVDTGAFILTEAGLMNGKRLTVHYEHADAFSELYPQALLIQDALVVDGDRISCGGGIAALNMGLTLVELACGFSIAKHAAQYLYHPNYKGPDSHYYNNAAYSLLDPVPHAVSVALEVMEQHMEDVLTIPEVAKMASVSHRQLDRLFSLYIKKSPALYYRDIRLDRARGLVTQTAMPFKDVAVASGFTSQVHFSRIYKARFGLSPKDDRVEGRVPFEYRLKPAHRAK